MDANELFEMDAEECIQTLRSNMERVRDVAGENKGGGGGEE